LRLLCRTPRRRMNFGADFFNMAAEVNRELPAVQMQKPDDTNFTN
jgi:hypothetical protein